jgi:uncharacterized protein DUF4410/polyglycine hydrolase-like protein
MPIKDSSMKRASFGFAAILALLTFHAGRASAQDLAKPAPSAAPSPIAVPVASRTVKQTYNAIQVSSFEIQKDVTFPPEYLALMQTEISKQLTSAKVFAEVVSAGQTASTPDAHLLRLTGVITNYNPGSRAKRYFGGGAAGAAEIDSKVTFVDATTGQSLMTQDLRAVLASGFFGGKSEDSVKDYARQVVNKAKLMLNMRVPAPGDAPAPIAGETPGAVVSSAPAHHTVIVSEKDWLGSQKKLDQESADGYRLTSVSITGTSTADLSFIRTDATADAFQYKLLHTVLSTSLQKDINKLAAEGYRVSPGTLFVLKAYPTVIVEKSVPPFKSRYEYLIKESMRVSSGEKDVEKVQAQGYTLIGETEHGTSHLLLFEKTSTGQ